MIRQMQMFILVALVGIVYPAELMVFYKYCVKIAEMDLYQG